MSSKDSRTVRSGGKLRDNIKELPIAIYPSVYPGKKQAGYHPVRLPSAGADTESYLRMYRVSGAGYADSA